MQEKSDDKTLSQIRVVHLSPDMAHFALLDNEDKEIKISAEQIVLACEKMDSRQIFPYSVSF